MPGTCTKPRRNTATPFEGTTTLAVTETGPLRAVVRVTRTHRASTLEQEIILYAEMPRLDFRTRIDWQERQTLLKVAFPVDIRATSATYEVQFGAYARATHRNTSWEQTKFEVPGQRWVDLSEAGYGVSLLNDGRYGYDTHDNVVRLTLLRGTIFPDPEADRGTHEVTYSLYPHAGGWTEAETVRRAWELNTPLYATPGATPAPTRFLRIDGSAILETLKPAEDGNGWIVRLYEPHGARGPVTVRSAMPLHAVTMCNAVEEGAEALPHDATAFTFLIRPFEIRTFRLIL